MIPDRLRADAPLRMGVLDASTKAIARKMGAAATAGTSVRRVLHVKVPRLGNPGKCQTCMTPRKSGRQPSGY